MWSARDLKSKKSARLAARICRLDDDYVGWLVEHSMLHNAKKLAMRYGGQGRMWQQPYAEARPRAASALASVWFTAYPAAVVTRPGESVLQTLGDPHLWAALSAIGVLGVHTGPMKRSGGVRGRDYTPTIDGNFDRISFEIDPAFGTEDDFVAMSRDRCRPQRGGDRRHRSGAYGQGRGLIGSPSLPTANTRASTIWSRSPRRIGICSRRSPRAARR